MPGRELVADDEDFETRFDLFLLIDDCRLGSAFGDGLAGGRLSTTWLCGRATSLERWMAWDSRGSTSTSIISLRLDIVCDWRSISTTEDDEDWDSLLSPTGIDLWTPQMKDEERWRKQIVDPMCY